MKKEDCRVSVDLLPINIDQRQLPVGVKTRLRAGWWGHPLSVSRQPPIRLV